MSSFTPTADENREMVRILIKAATAREHDPRAYDFAGWLAGQLAEAAARLGSSRRLLASRPGSWEAASIRQLLTGTVGPDDEYLPSVADGDRVPPPGRMGTGNVNDDDEESLAFADESDYLQ